MRLLPSLLLLSTAAGDNLTEPEVLPRPEPWWSDQPLCPLWGPMEGFYSEGVEAGRVGLIKETMMIYGYFLPQYLGRWWLQDKFAQLSDVTGKCLSQVYSVNFVNKTIHRQTDYLTPL